MADYASLKVPELKKLLQEKQLPVTGNKADLIARLQEHDKANEEPQPAASAAPAAPVSAEEDPIDYSDDDVPASKPTTEAAPAEEKVAEPTSTTENPADAAPALRSEDKPAEEGADDEKPAEATTEAEAAPKVDFSANLPASSADDEARKRAERAKRFGIVEDADEEAKKKTDRAQRFGLDQTSLVSGLDSALPEKRERKRGREGASNTNADGERGAKRQQHGQQGRRRGGRDNRSRGGRQGGNDRGPPRKEGGGGGKPRRVLDDPSERAKAEARAKRFGGGT
ncbi:hypothetical protein F5Y03DRAFT_355595 [Xylaria venustula]|nr:hypothetical protein F5Y03DRAFT_355595 [Xylaria venustula]